MEITPRDQALGDLKTLDPAHFTGKAGGHELLPARKPALPTTAMVVRFEPGARNYWHEHEGGQLLYVVEGAGWVQARGFGARRIQVGDAVRIEPNEEHWHGAGRSGPLAHVVVNVGETRWLEESPAPSEG
jgi:quercetin dioxygenase-like cupin family protein